MAWTVIVLLILSVVVIAFGLMLSSSGSTAGLTAMSGQDLELFKKTKDRGLVKWLQIGMYILLLVILILVTLTLALKWS
ncbi:MAG: preprotein translocase subunit SecG [Mycoplasmataceae bacterium]|nr:preprotein translocase subunit SecG [Mycoplasmataceae bacterium]